jgi:hypothetical protein
MNTFVAIVAIVVLLILLVFARRPNPEKAKRRRIAKLPDKKFHAVSLRFPPSACEAAQALGGRRFLSADAPRIPLDDCTVANCKCRFVHYKDRRSGDDRRDTYGQGIGGGNSGNYEAEQRKNRERREDPPDDSF